MKPSAQSITSEVVPCKRPIAGPVPRCRSAPAPPPAQPHRPRTQQPPSVAALPSAFVPYEFPPRGRGADVEGTRMRVAAAWRHGRMAVAPGRGRTPSGALMPAYERPIAGPVLRCRYAPASPPAQPHRPCMEPTTAVAALPLSFVAPGTRISGDKRRGRRSHRVGQASAPHSRRGMQAPHSRSGPSLPLGSGSASGPATPTPYATTAAGRCAPVGVLFHARGKPLARRQAEGSWPWPKPFQRGVGHRAAARSPTP